MKKLLFLVIIVLCECTDIPSKQQGNKIDNSITPLFSFHCSDYEIQSLIQRFISMTVCLL